MNNQKNEKIDVNKIPRAIPMNFRMPYLLKMRIQDYCDKNGFTFTQGLINLITLGLEHSFIDEISKEFPYNEDGSRD